MAPTTHGAGGPGKPDFPPDEARKPAERERQGSGGSSRKALRSRCVRALRQDFHHETQGLCSRTLTVTVAGDSSVGATTMDNQNANTRRASVLMVNKEEASSFRHFH